MKNTISNFTSNTKVRQWFTFERDEILLLLSIFIFAFAFANYEPYVPEWLQQIFLLDSYLFIGLIVVISSIISAIVNPIWGMFADKFGRKNFAIFGTIAFSFMFLCLLFAQESYHFLIIILIGYLFGTAQFASFYALSVKTINKPRGIVLAKISITGSFAWLVGSPLFGFIYDNFANSMIIQLIIALGTCFLSALLLIPVKENRIEEIKEEKTLDKPITDPVTHSPRIFLAVLFLTFLFQLAAGFWPYNFIYFRVDLGVSGLHYSYSLIARTALGIILAFLLGSIKKIRKVNLTIVGFLVWQTLIYSIISFFPERWLTSLVLFSAPLYPLYNVSFYSLITNYSTSGRRATAYGIFNSVGTTGYVAGTLILGTIADHSLRGIFIMPVVSIMTVGLTLFFSLTMFLVLKNRRNIDNHIT